nr:helix-turn-helix transcriptional regulator [Actinomyces sp.]
MGTRIRQRLRERGLSQAGLASSVGMSESALSKAISGTRGLSALEVAEIADELGVSMHWLVTGEADPFAVRLAARHEFDVLTRSYSCSPEKDRRTLEAVELLYRQAQSV